MNPFLRSPSRRCLARVIPVLIAWRPALAADLYVPADHATIQAAVNAASSGDTIHIAPGVYVEQTAITNKNLVLSGAPGAVIRASEALVPTMPHHCTPAVLGIVGSDVVVEGLTFEGEHLSQTYACSYGAVLFDGASGRVQDCAVHGFRAATALGGFNGFGVVADNYDASLRTVQVLRCLFADNGMSVHVRGSDGANDPVRVAFTIADNRIAGVGRTTLGGQIGILISAGASGEVLHNTITDHAFDGTTDASYGVFAVDWRYQFADRSSPIALAPIRYEGNTFRNNQVHIASALGHGSQFVNNTFEGGGVGSLAGGIALTGDTNRVVGNRFSNIPRGVILVGDDPDFHTAYGIARNTTLVDNRFCDVATPVEIQLLVTGTTEQGSLRCPFPPPMLDIAPAVLLAWSGDAEGFVLESAASVAGPWLPTTATPSQQDNQNTVTVKTDTQQQYFRLRER